MRGRKLAPKAGTNVPAASRCAYGAGALERKRKPARLQCCDIGGMNAPAELGVECSRESLGGNAMRAALINQLRGGAKNGAEAVAMRGEILQLRVNVRLQTVRMQ